MLSYSTMRLSWNGFAAVLSKIIGLSSLPFSFNKITLNKLILNLFHSAQVSSRNPVQSRANIALFNSFRIVIIDIIIWKKRGWDKIAALPK